MPARVRVPPDQRGTMSMLASMDEPRWHELIAALEAQSGLTHLDTLASDAAEVFGDQTATSALLQAAVSIEMLRQAHSWSRKEVLEALEGAEGLDALSSSQTGQLIERLESLLALPAITRVAKVEAVSGEYDAVFHTCRVLTDLRPVFDEDPSGGPLGMLMTHVLKIDFVEDRRSKSLRVAMTKSDLEMLRETINRAFEKLTALRSWLIEVDMHELTEDDS